MYKERDIHGDIVEGGIDNSPIFDHIMSLGYTHEGFTRGIDNDREPRWIYTIDTENITKEELLKKMERKAMRSVQHVQKYNMLAAISLSLSIIPT